MAILQLFLAMPPLILGVLPIEVLEIEGALQITYLKLYLMVVNSTGIYPSIYFEYVDLERDVITLTQLNPWRLYKNIYFKSGLY